MVHKAPKQHTIESLRKGKRNGELYRKEYDGIAARLVKHTAATVSEIAEVLGVSVGSIYNWQSRYPSFQAALAIPQEMANHRVALSIYNQAIGYYYEDEEIKILDGAICRVKIKRWMPPNVSAAIYYSKAKMGWTDREQSDPALPSLEESQTIDGVPDESPRQRARRIAMVLIQGGLKDTG